MNTKTLLILAALLGTGVAQADVAPPAPAEQAMSNKALVTEMFQKLFVEKKVAEYADQYLAPDFIEHDPLSKNGTKALKAFFKDYLKKNPDSVISVKRIVAEGDRVFVHFHWQTNPKDRGVAGTDIFRVEHGLVVEHWDVMQPVPEKSANTNTMF